MNLDIQYKIKSNPNCIRYIRQHSYWYKYLNRNPYMFSTFMDNMKEEYKLRTSDKFNDTLEKIQMVQSLLSMFK